MAFIKAQKVIRNENGMITSGSASIVDTIYVSTGAKSHSKQVVREKLGRVLYLSEDRKCGVFMSPTRGLIEYDALTDSFGTIEQDDPRISGHELFPEAEIHTVFGDTYLLLHFLEKCGLIPVLRKVFPADRDYERALSHILHDILRDGSRITCDNFFGKSFASYILTDIKPEDLREDADYYMLMGDEEIRRSYFRDFVAAMREKSPSFGQKCYVNSIALPDDLEGSPYKALESADAALPDASLRLILVTDEETGLLVWFDILSGQPLDMVKLMVSLKDVAPVLGITINSLILDADYVSKDLIRAFHTGGQENLIGRMPDKKGFPFKALYQEMKDLIGKDKYAFVHAGRPFFGIRKKIILFKEPVYAYVFVDHAKARKGFYDFLAEHEEEFDGLKGRDKDWYRVRYGYFILLSNIETEPASLLADYCKKTDKDIVQGAPREYLAVMPLEKWTNAAVRGKLLHDIVSSTAQKLLRRTLAPSGFSSSEVFGSCQSLMCCRKRDGTITIETPGKAVQTYYKALGTSVPAHLKDDTCRAALGL